MAQANNYFNISGNIVRDPEIRLTTKQTKYCFITLAVNGLGKDKVDFIRVCFWAELADNIKKYCHKGDCLTICGHISTFKNKDNITEQTLTADGFTILRSKKSEQPASEAPDETPKTAEAPKTPTYGDVFAEMSEPFTPFS